MSKTTEAKDVREAAPDSSTPGAGGGAFIPLNLYRKIFKLAHSVDGIETKGQNKKHGYSYAREADIIMAVRKTMQQLELLRIPVKYKSKGEPGRAHVTCCSRWVDLDTGEYHDLEIDGMDVNGTNKANWSAYTGALKYELRHMIFAPTGDDPEAFSDDGARRKDDRKVDDSDRTPSGDTPPKFTSEEWQFIKSWIEQDKQLAPYYNAFGKKFRDELFNDLKNKRGSMIWTKGRAGKAKEVYDETIETFRAEAGDQRVDEVSSDELADMLDRNEVREEL